MKKVIFLIFILLCANSFCFAQKFRKQSFKKGTITVDAGVGFGVYSSATNDDNDTTHAVAPVLIPVSIEYGISNNVGVGLMLERNGFLVAGGGSASSLNIGVKGVFYFANEEVSTFYSDLVVGYSAIKAREKTKLIMPVKQKWSGTGITYQLSFGFKTYFSRKAGWFISLGYAGYLYNELIDQSDNANPITPELQTSDQKFLTINMNGVNLRTGIVIKLL